MSKQADERCTILFVDHTPFAGGAQLVLVAHIAALDASKFRAVVACSNQTADLPGQFRDAGAEVVILPMPRLRGNFLLSLSEVWRTIRLLRALIINRSDIVVCNTTRASYYVWVAGLMTGKPVIWWIRDYLYPKILLRLMGTTVDRFVFVSKSVARWYGLADSGKTSVLYVASDLHEHLSKVDPKEIEAAKTKWSIHPDDTVVGFMGRLVEEKGAEDVIKAVAKLTNRYPKLKLLVIGTGQGQRHNVEPELHSYVREQGLDKAIRFTGYQPNQALYYSILDIFVLATRDREPFATSMVQAMMAEAAVIGSNAGGTPELVVDDQTGLLYPPGEVDSLASAIERLATDLELRHKLTLAAKQRVLQYHTEESLARQAESLYDSLIEQHRAVRK